MSEESPLQRELSAIKAVMELPDENRHRAVRDLILRVLLDENPDSAVVEILRSIIREKVASPLDPDSSEREENAEEMSEPVKSAIQNVKREDLPVPTEKGIIEELSRIIGDNPQYTSNQCIMVALALLEVRLEEQNVTTERLSKLLVAANRKIANISSHLQQLRNAKKNRPVRATRVQGSQRYRYSLTTGGLKMICREAGIR